MTTESKRAPHYGVVFAGLLVLTLIEVGVAYLPLQKPVQVLALLSLAVAKALLVVLYYMHLKFERLLIYVVLAAPLLLSLLLIGLNLLETY